MYTSENELLSATDIIGYDKLAQRALRLRLKLRDLIPFATNDRVAIQGIFAGARHANAMLVICHNARGYQFVHLQLLNQSTGKGEISVIDFLPAVDDKLPLEELEGVICMLEGWPEKMREAHALPKVLISGVSGAKILRGGATFVTGIEMREQVANDR